MAEIYCIVNRTMMLSKPTPKVLLAEPLVYNNAKAHAMQVTVLNDDGTDASLSGVSVTGTMMLRGNGTTVTPLTGSVSGNVAQIILSAACYAVPGRFTFIMNMTKTGGYTRGALIVEGRVERTTTGSAVDPGTPVTDYSTIIANANAAAEAAEEAAENASAFTGAIAPTYADLMDTSPFVTLGAYDQHCWYDGQLYVNKVDISSAETWTASHWEAVDISGELYKANWRVTSLKTNVMREDYWDSGKLAEMKYSGYVNGYYINYASGAIAENSDYCYSGNIYILPYSDFKLVNAYGDVHVTYWDVAGNFISGELLGSTHGNQLTIPTNCDSVVLSYAISERNQIALAYINNVLSVGVGRQFATIGSAILAANDNDTIVVYPGVYTETIDANAKKVHIRGTSKAQCMLTYSADNYAYPPLSIAKGSVSNMTIYAYWSGSTANTRAYCVHIDSDYERGERLSFDNVDFVTDRGDCVGIGTRTDCDLKFTNCLFHSKASAVSGCIYNHDSESESTGINGYNVYENQNVEYINCTMINETTAYTIVLQSQERLESCCNITFVGNQIIQPNNSRKTIAMTLWQGRALTNDHYLGSSDFVLTGISGLNTDPILGYCNVTDGVSDDISNLRTEVIDFSESSSFATDFANTIVVGEYWKSNGDTASDSATARSYRGLTNSMCAIKMSGSTYLFRVAVFNASNVFQKFLTSDYVSGLVCIPEEYPQFALNIKRVDGSSISSSDVTPIKSALTKYYPTDKSEYAPKYLNMVELEQGAITTSGTISGSTKRIRTADYYGGYFTVFCPPGFGVYLVAYYDKDTLAFDSYDSPSTVSQIKRIGKADCVAKLVIAKTDTDQTITVDELSTFYATHKGGIVEELRNEIITENIEFEQGAINTSGVLSNSNYRVRSTGYIRGNYTIKVQTGYRIYMIVYFDEDDFTFDSVVMLDSNVITSYDVGKSDCVSKIVVANADPSVAISPNEINRVIIGESDPDTENYPMMWTYGWVKNDGTLMPSESRKDIRTKYRIRVKAGLVISCESGSKFGCSLFNSSTGAFISKRGMSADSYTIPSDCDILIDAEYSPAVEITDMGDLCSKINFIPTIKQTFDFLNDEVIDLEQTLESVGLAGGSLDKRSATSFVNIPVGLYYKGLGAQYNMGFSASTTSAEVISAFDSLVSSYGSNYITKTDLGVCSDGTNHIYSYTFNPKFATYTGTATPKKYPKILIMTAQHGFEKSSVFGMYYFLRDVLTKWKESPILDYFRHHCIIEYIPVANPYGFDNNIYYNINGVNINRNYDTEGFPYDPTAEPWTSQYGGVEAFDQEETQIIRDWVLDNLDAVIGIDFHTNGGSSITDWKDLNWIAFTSTPNKYYHKLWEAAFSHFANTTAHFVEDYNLDIGTAVLGRATGINNTRGISPTADVWMTTQGIPGLTFEGFNGFYGDTAFTADAQKANSELIGNWLISALNALR